MTDTDTVTDATTDAFTGTLADAVTGMTADGTADILGRGWAFPIRLGADGCFALAGGADDVSQAIRLILGTACGERPMRPEYGCRIHDRIFDSFDAALAGQVRADVEDSLRRWEPRIEVTSVACTPDPERPHVLVIDLHYRIVATNDRRNLVFPFYSIPEE